MESKGGRMRQKEETMLVGTMIVCLIKSSTSLRATDKSPQENRCSRELFRREEARWDRNSQMHLSQKTFCACHVRIQLQRKHTDSLLRSLSASKADKQGSDNHTEVYTVILQYPWGTGSRIPADTESAGTQVSPVVRHGVPITIYLLPDAPNHLEIGCFA